jgi:hypothetical protein
MNVPDRRKCEPQNRSKRGVEMKNFSPYLESKSRFSGFAARKLPLVSVTLGSSLSVKSGK